MNSFKKSTSLFFIALALNLIWEFSHYHLYIDTSAIQGSTHLVIASLFDALFILGIFDLISLKHRNFNWIFNPSKADHLAIILGGLLIAIFIEVINLHLGRWSYTSAMPTLFGMGLSPLAQLATTGIVSLYILKSIDAKFRKNKKNS